MGSGGEAGTQAGYGTFMPNPPKPAASGEVPWAGGYENPGYGAGYYYNRPLQGYGPGPGSGGAAGAMAPSFSLQPNAQVVPGQLTSSINPSVAAAGGGAFGSTVPSPSAVGSSTGYQQGGYTPTPVYQDMVQQIQNSPGGIFDFVARMFGSSTTPTVGPASAPPPPNSNPLVTQTSPFITPTILPTAGG